MNELIFLLLLFGLPAAVGARFAVARDRNPLAWGLLCGVIPFFLVVIYFRKPTREVRGHFRLCTSCGETFPWKDQACKYCGTAI
ncbi:MAG: hypothetical protein WCP10_05480 [Desulfuromonadales bacterium]